MTREEFQQEAADAMRQFAAQIAASGQETTGIPRPATIESSETSLDPTLFRIGLDPQTIADAFPGGGFGHGPVKVCSHCSLGTIEVVIAGLGTCPPYTDINLNGIFTLTFFESCGWVGTGGQFDQGFGPQDAFLLVTCPENVIYAADTGFANQFFAGVGPPGTTLFNNLYVTCGDGGAGFGGTFST